MRRNWLEVAFIAATIFLVAAFGRSVTDQIHAQRNEHTLSDNMSLVAQALQSEIARLGTLLDILREDSRIVESLDGTSETSVAPLVDHLNLVSERTGVRLIFIIDEAGDVIASSNWNGRHPPPSTDLAFRPYFRDAMQHGRTMLFSFANPGEYPGFYASSRIALPTGKTGVVVVKIEVGLLESSWRRLDSIIALADEAGVIFMSNRDEWKLRPLRPLSESDLASIARYRIYGNIDLSTRRPLFGTNVDIENKTIAIAGDQLMIRTQNVGDFGWQLVVAQPIVMPNVAANVAALLIILVGLIIASGVYIYRQRGLLIRLKNEQSVLLEHKVEERTRELAAEVEHRRRTEQSLRHVEQDLVQAAKLAALGQMSAALAHEVSQPVIALAATLTAAERRLGASENENAQHLIARAQSLTRRIQHIIRHLRSFSKKESGEGERMDIAASIEAALELAETRAREIGVTIEAVGLDQQVAVFGNPVRLEQVLINLLLNALDAVVRCDRREVGIRLSARKRMARVEVWDTGPGIPDGFRTRLSEPFFTTKTNDDGIGLGLSISQSILADFGATMRFFPRKGGGTVCEVRLPLAIDKQTVEAAE